MTDTADIASYGYDKTPCSVGKNKVELEKKNYKRHQSNILNYSMNMT